MHKKMMELILLKLDNIQIISLPAMADEEASSPPPPTPLVVDQGIAVTSRKGESPVFWGQQSQILVTKC